MHNLCHKSLPYTKEILFVNSFVGTDAKEDSDKVTTESFPCLSVV